MKKQFLTTAALAAAMGFATLAHADTTDTHDAATADKEKCYGVVKAGKNDCHGQNNSCAGSSTADRAADAWVFVPTGLCDKLAGGSLTAPVDVTAPAIAHETHE